MSVYDKVRNGDYETALAWPEKPKLPDILSRYGRDLSDADLARLPQVRRDYEASVSAHNEAARRYREDEGTLTAKFQEDIEEEFGTTGHDKAGLLFAKAWEHGHSSGLGEVYTAYQDLVELVDVAPRPGMSPR